MTTSQAPNKPSRKRRFAIATALIVLVLAAVALLTARTSTPAFTSANAIAEERRMLIGGVEQYVLLRGSDRSAPLLVFVHGGPGASATPFLRTYNAALEDDFVMVYWDQRGAVKSFDGGLDSAEINIPRMTADLGELIDQLLIEFNQEQVLLVGHSWGTVLALEYAATNPQTVAAYIAISQTTNQIASDTAGYEWALAEAKATGNSNAQEALETLGAPPYTVEQFGTQRRFVNVLGGGLVEPQSDLDLLRTALATDEFSWATVPNLLRGNRLSAESLWPEQQQYDATTRHTSIDVPYYLMLGRHDRIISPELGAAFFEQLEAPAKQLMWFEQSAHSPLFEEPAKFNEAVKQAAQAVGLLAELAGQ